MCNRDWAVAAVLVLASAMACAQPAKADSAASSTAAMERARRQAAGPMRIILEASKPRRRGAEAEAAVPADANAVRPVATRAVAAPAAAAAAAASAPEARAPAPASATPTVASAPVADAPRAQPAAEPVPADSGIVTEITLTPDRVRAGASAAAVPALDRSAATAVEVVLPGTPAVNLPALAQAPVRPRLKTMVEPEVPQRVLDALNRNTAVLVDVTIRANGTVAGVELLPPAPRQLQRYVALALEQWRFDPLPAERVHRVELVFNAER